MKTGYIFVKLQDEENNFDLTTVKFLVDKTADKNKLIEEFFLFLKASGFCFAEGETLGIINEEV